MSLAASNALLPVAVLVSGTGRGSNLGALIVACESGEIAARIALVIGTRSRILHFCPSLAGKVCMANTFTAP
jgi:folate-dependent phosphoribosylglycinamide formyltransferase PurN